VLDAIRTIDSKVLKTKNMAELKWKEAIEKVLNEEKKELHYTEIAELIAQKGYRTSLGATPQDTVSAQLTIDIKKGDSIFAKVGRGIFILKRFLNEAVDNNESEEVLLGKKEVQIFKKKKEPINNNIINAFGIYWSRVLVHWKSATPDLLGIQQIGASEVNFKDQKGIYLLHDGRETIYVGQAIDQTIGKRLKDHTTDRLAGRWDRFSWFGFYPVKDNGELNLEAQFKDFTIQILGDVLEAILIETIEPRQNRKKGNSFEGLEFLQQEAPEIKRKQKKQLLDEFYEQI
jgi:hypothetical protein